MSSPDAQSAASLSQVAASAMRSREFDRAATLLEQALAVDEARLDLWLGLAAAHRASGALDKALDAANRALRLKPRHFQALLLRGSLLERLQGERIAAPVYGAAILQAPDEERVDEPTRRALAHARQVNERYGAELNAALQCGLDDLSLSSSAAKNTRIFVDLLTGRRRNYRQEPLGYFYPGLPAVEFWPREQFPWIEALEGCALEIAREMRAIGFEDPSLTPYIDFPDLQPLDQWAELNRSPRWTAFHLYQHGRRVEENCARCPATMDALKTIDQPVAVNRSPSAMFSMLQSRIRIPSHTGVANTRLVAHLALHVPDGCGFRVGGETRAHGKVRRSAERRDRQHAGEQWFRTRWRPEELARPPGYERPARDGPQRSLCRLRHVAHSRRLARVELCSLRRGRDPPDDRLASQRRTDTTSGVGNQTKRGELGQAGARAVPVSRRRLRDLLSASLAKAL